MRGHCKHFKLETDSLSDVKTLCSGESNKGTAQRGEGLIGFITNHIVMGNKKENPGSK